MAKFKFRLSTLLRLRESARDERRARLAQAHRAEEILRIQQERLASELNELEALARRTAAPGTVQVDRLIAARRYQMALQSQAQELGRKQQAVQEEIGRRLEALVEANREVRVLETLRQKQLERHRQEENRQEIKQLDEAAGRSARKDSTTNSTATRSTRLDEAARRSARKEDGA